MQVKAQEKYGKGADYKEKVKEEGRIDYCEVLVKRQQNSGKAELCKAAGEATASGIHRAEAAASGGKRRQVREPASEGEQTTTVGENKMRGGRRMVEKESRQASRQMAAENGNQRGKAQSTAPARRKGYFYLLLAAWWPTAKGRRWLARKGVERRLEALKESQNCAAKV